jgi:hypothetical protein
MPSTVSMSSIAPREARPLLRTWFGCSGFTLMLYVVFCLALAAAGYFRSLPTYDRFLYAGAVASLRYSDPVTIHRIARQEFDVQPSPFPYKSIPGDAGVYTADLRDNPYHFVQHLGMFRVKMGYVAIGYVLWRAGLHILVALRLVSAFSFFVVGIAVLAWTRDVVLSTILLLIPPILNLGRLVTADPLATAVIVLALFAFARKRELLAVILLLASILVRSDNVVLVGILIAWMVWKRYLRLSRGALFEVLALAMAVAINRIAGLFSWRIIMQHGFVKPVIEPINHPVFISFAGYLHAIVELRAIPYSFMTVWLLVAVAAWKLLPSGSLFRDLLPIVGVSIVVRLAIFPNPDDRFFVWAYILAAVALIQEAQTPDQDVPDDTALREAW